MFVVVENQNFDRYKEIVDEMFRLRARVFSEKLGWEVEVADGMERDLYDDLNPVYLIHLDKAGKIRGSMRLLPTTGRTLLYDVFSETVPDAACMVAPGIWECSRFCIDEELVSIRSRSEALQESALMLAAVGELGLQRGITAIVGNFDPVMLRVYRRAGVKVDVIGRTDAFGPRPVCLGLFDVREDIYRGICERMGFETPLIHQPKKSAAALAA